ncbi:hypothetical protein K474DRAFT_38533 [Panus rudis PR-1116 ss-1]|nr:hypothetical protein K474DRAFT_38533 [Panus rudis PR-1116 ss-1]
MSLSGLLIVCTPFHLACIQSLLTRAWQRPPGLTRTGHSKRKVKYLAYSRMTPFLPTLDASAQVVIDGHRWPALNCQLIPDFPSPVRRVPANICTHSAPNSMGPSRLRR